MRIRAAASLTLVALAASLSLTACGSDSDASSGNGADDSYKIGLLLPETAVARYDGKDKPYFEAKLKELCPDCEFLYANANSDAGEQNDQANSFLSQGVDVLVVDPFDGKAAASIVNSAEQVDVPVVAYDRLIDSPDLDYVISNDYLKVGELQAQSLVDKLEADGVKPGDGGILMMNGATTDNNAGNIKAGAMSVIEGSGYEVLADIDTWDPAEAQEWVSGQITQFGDEIVGIYSANDGNAGGAIAALKADGVASIPPMTGLDASVAGLQSILVGDLYMTTYNSFKAEAESAAEVALQLAKGETPDAPADVEGIPATLNEPVAVTLDNMADTVFADDFYTVDEICTGKYADACSKAGIS
ncbi:substrate-binding domain-containing protein [Nocardioides astragali]|uniref:Substrate-binding domain-containing protein n=1 Tax=Nocardioides astragali TaxID=1776736 RepID=A0ABW2N966_9ACTN|nr:substrate-binding domain-containing protein [Nocardioides astragali]